MTSLFVSVMEAEGNELQPFSNEVPDEDNVEQSQPVTNNQMDDDSQPPPLQEDDNDLSFSSENDDSDNESIDNDGSDNMEMADDNNKDTSSNQDNLSKKANNILNQQLYEQMIAYNDDLSSLLDNIQTIIPVLPYETVREIDNYTMKLQETLVTSKNYVINKFINSQYGENLLFFEKLKSLCSILKNQINKNLKQIEKS